MSVAAQLQVLVSANTTGAIASLNRLDAATKRSATSAQASGTALERAFGRRGAMAAKGGVLALGAALYGSIKVGMDFEKQMSNLESVTGATEQQMGKLETQARELGRSTIFSATEVADAQTELAKGGLKVRQIIGGALPAALSLAAAGDMELADAASTVTNAMNLFGLEGENASKVADMLATAANTTTADVGDFAMALTQGGSAAKQAGLSLNDTVVILEALAQAGVKNSDAGTSMKTALLQLLAPTNKQAALAKQLGLEFVNQAGAMKNPIQLAGELRDKLKGMTQAQRVATLKTLAGTDGFRTLAALYDLGAKNAGKLAKANEEVGTAQETAAKRTDNLAGDLERLKGTIQDKALNIYDVLKPQLRDAAQLLEKGLSGIKIPPIDIGQILTSGDALLGSSKSIGENIGRSLSGGVSAAAQNALGKVKRIAGQGADIALGVGGNAVGQARSVWAKVRATVSRGISFLLSIPSDPVGAARTLWNKVKGVVGRAITMSIALPGGIVSLASSLWDRINSAFPDIHIGVSIDNPFTGGGAVAHPGGVAGHAKGASNFRGGAAIVNERGAEMAELNGRFWMLGNGKAGAQMTYVPRGAEIFTASDTRKLMAAGVPAFKGGHQTKAQKKAAREAKRQRKLDKQQAARDSVQLNLEAALAAAELTPGFADDIAAIGSLSPPSGLLGYWGGVAAANKNANKIKNPLKRKAGLERLIEARGQIKDYTDQLAELTGGASGTGGANDSERAALLQELLNAANLRTAVSQAQYGVLAGTGPGLSSFANGTPGSSAKVAVYMHEGGTGADVFVNDRRVEAAVERLTRKQARRGGRGLPSRGGGLN